jgi:hypothetical protein
LVTFREPAGRVEDPGDTNNMRALKMSC